MKLPDVLDAHWTPVEKLSMDMRASSLPLETSQARPADAEGTQSEIAFRGLAVRMVIATGRADSVNFHGISRRMEYEGKVCFVARSCIHLRTKPSSFVSGVALIDLQSSAHSTKILQFLQMVKLLRAISSIAHGSQVLIDSQTFSAIHSSLPDIVKLLRPRPDFGALAKFAHSRCFSVKDCFASSTVVPEFQYEGHCSRFLELVLTVERKAGSKLPTAGLLQVQAGAPTCKQLEGFGAYRVWHTSCKAKLAAPLALETLRKGHRQRLEGRGLANAE